MTVVEGPRGGGPPNEAPRTLLIGLTGPIGCGKSTIGRLLAERGGVVVDADRLSHEASGPGTDLVARIAKRFGRELITEDGSLDRAALGRIVFGDPEALGDLEAIVQPAVRVLIEERVAAAEAAGTPFVAVEAIKLVEAGYAAQCDEVWIVTCTPDQQRERLVARGLPPDQIERRMAAQGADLVERLRPHATAVIDASGSMEETRRRADAALDVALRRHSGQDVASA